MQVTPKIAIQGELGSNSHMAAEQMLSGSTIVPCTTSSEVVDHLVRGAVDGAVLPFENSLHGSVAEHNDLLLRSPLRITRESLLRIQHHVIAAPGVSLADLDEVLSHPVALSQCRRWLAEHSSLRATPFYDTAGAARHVVGKSLPNVAAVAPQLAATLYGGTILARNIEDNPENLTRFHLLVRETEQQDRFGLLTPNGPVNKMSLAFAIEHRPGTLVRALGQLHLAGVNLSKIESRPVPGSPWQYIFHVDLRFTDPHQADRAIADLRPVTEMLKDLGRYHAAEEPTTSASGT